MDRSWLDGIVYGGSPGGPGGRRYTQDSPVLPDVWTAFAAAPGEPQRLLLTPHEEASSGEVSKTLRQRIGLERQRAAKDSREPHRLAYTQVSMLCSLYFDELVRVVLPMTPWWQRYVRSDLVQSLIDDGPPALLLEALAGNVSDPGRAGLAPELVWMVRVVGAIAALQGGRSPHDLSVEDLAEEVRGLLSGFTPPPSEAPRIWLVSRNRAAYRAIHKSVLATKADAARRLFDLSCRDLCWAIIDAGVDAMHPALRQVDEQGRARHTRATTLPSLLELSRVERTYDFTRIADLLDPERLQEGVPPRLQRALSGRSRRAQELRRTLRDLQRALLRGREIDWKLLEPLLRIQGEEYRAPVDDHGTHVAGILAAAPSAGEDGAEPTPAGMCPDLRLWDLRVLDDEGNGDEFGVIAALQFVRHINAERDHRVVHGVNVSLSIRNDVTNYGCGRTPVCDECERLVASGVVAVVAAGNEGYSEVTTAAGPTALYHAMSITDPGNTDAVITVGATHRNRPHEYGVSYFSSRGPTGDGRVKPDLVAPGEKIRAPVAGGGFDRKDGTSMAAPHVSGAAALLMARHNELVGQPGRVKRILCETATDLGRERYFQGAGMLDALRALQAV